MLLSNKTKRTKVSHLLSCYGDLLNGMSLEELFDRYIHVEVLVALELFEKGVTLQQLADFVKKRDAHLAKMRREKL